jgi:ketosteroid isomerase-like protein
VQSGDIDDKAQSVKTYFDAVTRAASDEGRCVQREDVLFKVIQAAEKQMNLDELQESFESSSLLHPVEFPRP